MSLELSSKPQPLPPAAKPTGSAAPRLHLVDFWRGVAILAIFINHLPANPLKPWTTHSHGFSDTAAWFFLLSGVVAHLVYGRMLEQRGLAHTVRMVGKRMVQLYFCQLLLSGLFILAAQYLTQRGGPLPWWSSEPAYQLAVRSPSAAVGAALALNLNGFCNDILPAYVVILAVFLGTLYAKRRWGVPPMVIAFALYAAALVSHRYVFAEWSFNPFAWQLLFHLGGWVYESRDRLVSGGLRTGLVLAAALATLVFCAVVQHAQTLLPMPWAYWVSLLAPSYRKALLEWPYLCHSILTIFCLAMLVPNALVPQRSPLRYLAGLGKKPLPLFVLTTAISYCAYCMHGNQILGGVAFGYLAFGLLLYAAYDRIVAFLARPAAPRRGAT